MYLGLLSRQYVGSALRERNRSAMSRKVVPRRICRFRRSNIEGSSVRIWRVSPRDPRVGFLYSDADLCWHFQERRRGHYGL